jgi:hypothetical protein
MSDVKVFTLKTPNTKKITTIQAKSKCCFDSAIAGIVIYIVWRKNILAYKELNKAN